MGNDSKNSLPAEPIDGAPDPELADDPTQADGSGDVEFVDEAPNTPVTETDGAGEADHEYREVADHVEARVSTDEEKAQRQALVAREVSQQN